MRDCLTGVYEGYCHCTTLHIGPGYDMDGTSTITVGPEMGGQARITVDVQAEDIVEGPTRAELTGSAEGVFDCTDHRVRFAGGSAEAVGEGFDVDLFLRTPAGTSGGTGVWVDAEQRWTGSLIWIQSEGEDPPTCIVGWGTLGY